VTAPSDVNEGLRLYRRLLGYAWPYKWIFPIALVGMLLDAAVNSGLAAIMKPLVDEGFGNRNPDIIRQAPIWLVLLFLARGFTSFFAEYPTSWLGRRVIHDLRNVCVARLLRLPNGFFDLHAPSRLVAKLMFDLEQI